METPIVVLGAAHYNGRPSRVLRGRLNRAARAHAAAPDSRIYTVGGAMPGDELSEAAAGARFLAQRGIAATALEVGHDTEASLQAVYSEIGPVACRIVTDSWHCPRTWLIARGLGLKPRMLPTWVALRPASLVRSLAHEAGGLMVWAIKALLGPGAAEAARSGLYRIEGIIRPAYRERHRFMAGQKR